MEKKITKRERFETLIKFVMGDVTFDADVANEYVEFLNHEIELVSKKRTGETKVQKRNKELAEIVLAKMSEIGEKINATDLFKALSDVEEIASVQKVTSLLNALKANGAVIKTEEKGKSFYEVA
jgi:uncharacterized membrane protein YvbJ